jgi:hypothetical protein
LTLEEVINVKYEPPQTASEGGEKGVGTGKEGEIMGGRNRRWNWLPRRAAFLVKALPKEVKRVRGEGRREEGREGRREKERKGGKVGGRRES